jgi:L-glyceraldehyde 3-phosphate reductase
MTAYLAAPDRYDRMPYRRLGRSGVQLPVLSLGLWQSFGDDRPIDEQRAVIRAAFDAGITHFDLANNYGVPAGSAERNFGRVLATDLAPYRDELIVTTKAGWDMWPGPYGDGGSRKYLSASLDASLRRLGLDYVDVYYSHRRDPDTPLEETIGALASAVRSGKALYVGISSYSTADTVRAAELLADAGVPLLVHQPSYSMLNRWIEDDHLLDALEQLGVGAVAFSPLSQGLLTSKYVTGIPADSRGARSGSPLAALTRGEGGERLRALHDIATARGQSLSQMALAWALRDARMTSLVMGARTVDQLTDNLAALDRTDFTADELAAIDTHALGDLWAPVVLRP